MRSKQRLAQASGGRAGAQHPLDLLGDRDPDQAAAAEAPRPQGAADPPQAGQLALVELPAAVLEERLLAEQGDGYLQ